MRSGALLGSAFLARTRKEKVMTLFRSARRYGSPDSLALHAEHPPVDLHADTLLWAKLTGYDLSKRHSPPLPGSAFMGHVDLPRLKDAGMGAVVFGLTAHPLLGGACHRATRQIDALDAQCRKHPGLILLARSADDMAEPGSDGPLAAFLAVEGAHVIDGSMARFDLLVKRGVRVMGFAHFSANRACRPSVGYGIDDSEGLSGFGRKLLERCEGSGVIVDLAHINRRGFMEVCAAATKPVIVSHTGVSSVHAHKRNVDDDQLRAVADTGGVVGVMFAPVFLGGRGIDAVADHLYRVISVAGEEHVAIGSDYDGMIVPVAGLKQVSMLPNLTDELLGRRWSAGRIARLLRGNALRVLQDVLHRTV